MRAISRAGRVPGVLLVTGLLGCGVGEESWGRCSDLGAEDFAAEILMSLVPSTDADTDPGRRSWEIAKSWCLTRVKIKGSFVGIPPEFHSPPDAVGLEEIEAKLFGALIRVTPEDRAQMVERLPELIERAGRARALIDKALEEDDGSEK